MELSIIIISYNTKDLTRQCIESIINEGSKIDLEIIVVDNDSKDGSVEELKELWKKYKNLKLIENKENVGFSKANNQGIKTASGRYILLLNSDTKVKRYVFKKLLSFAEKTDDAGVVSPKLLNGDGTLQPSCFYFPTIRNAIREYWLGQKGLFEKYVPKVKKPVVVEAVVGAAFLITPKALNSVGLLDERYFMFFEDLDYCKRVQEKGLKVYYYPGASIVHYHGASGKKIADQENQWRRLIPSSKIYHGVLKHYFLTAILWLGQKWQKLVK
ncbi:MAG: glycosyltransferase family 2 protein [Patescibacteria group bacterium]